MLLQYQGFGRNTCKDRPCTLYGTVKHVIVNQRLFTGKELSATPQSTTLWREFNLCVCGNLHLGKECASTCSMKQDEFH